jgi:hypothetical protein
MAWKKQGRKKLPEEKKLKYILSTRVTAEKYKELTDILNSGYSGDMSKLARDILDNRKIKVFTHDPSIDPVLKELSEIRGKIRLTGQHINTQTRLFNSSTIIRAKQFYARMAFEQYITLKDKIDRSYEIVSELAKRWLGE